MNIVVFATDILPLPGIPTSGITLRTFGIIQGLRSHGHQVITSVPKLALERFLNSPAAKELSESALEELRQWKRFAFDENNQLSLVEALKPDFVLCGHWPALAFGRRPSCPVVVDLAGPHLLERHYSGQGNFAQFVGGKIAALRHADYFIVSSEKQRRYFLPFLLRAGHEQLEDRIVQLTMAMDPRLPQRSLFAAQSFPRLVFGGILLPWQDPRTALTCAYEAIQRRSQGSLLVVGGTHPTYSEIVDSSMLNFLDSLGPNFERRPLLPYADFVDLLSECSAAIDCMAHNFERELAVSIRTTTYLWAGVPPIYNNYSDLSDLIAAHDAGWCIDPSNTAAVHSVIDEIFDHPELVLRKSQNAQRLAREHFRWDSAVSPLLALIGSGHCEIRREFDIAYDFPREEILLDGLHTRRCEQHFLCRLPGLSEVRFRVASTANSEIRVSLKTLEPSNPPESNSAQMPKPTPTQMIAERDINPSREASGDWLALKFQPQRLSAGQQYTLCVEAIHQQSSGVRLPVMHVTPYPMLDLRLDNRSLHPRACCLQTICQTG